MGFAYGKNDIDALERYAMKRVLIFGVGGFVGKYLTDEFQKYGYEVYGSDTLEKCPEGILFRRVDLLNAEAVAGLVADVCPDAIVNLAAISSVGLSWKIPQMTVQVNVVGALNILEAAKTLSPMPKVLFIGSSEEYAESDKPIRENSPLNANNPYGISKMAQEKFAESYRDRYGIQVYCVRAFNHTGIGQSTNFVIPSWCKQVAQISQSGKPGVMRVGNLYVERDFGDVRDVVRAYRMVLESNDCRVIYNIGTGKSVLLKDLLDYIISLSNQPIAVEVEPSLIRPVDTPYICCDHTLITQKLGWAPEYTLFDTVREMVEEFVGESHGKNRDIEC